MSPWLVAFFVLYKFMVPKYFLQLIFMLLLMYHYYLYSISKIFLKKTLHFFVGTFNHHWFCYINKGPQFSLFPASISYVASHRHGGLLFPTGVQMWHLEAQRSLWHHIRNNGQNDKQSFCSWCCLWTDTLVLNGRVYISTSVRWFELLFVLFSAMSKSVHM